MSISAGSGPEDLYFPLASVGTNLGATPRGYSMTERTVDTKSVLLVDETLDDEEGEHCDALMNVTAATDRAELFVTFPTDATDIVGFGNIGMGRQPAKRGLITVGESVAAAGAETDPDFDDPIVEASVSSANNLRDLGATISEFCQAWQQRGFDIGVCIDDAHHLVDANDPEQVFQFLHVLLGRLESVGATTHVHIDPDHVPEPTRMTFEQLFDETEHEEVELDHLIPTGRSRASDDDVASAVGDDASTRSHGGGDEASDDDIADALPD